MATNASNFSQINVQNELLCFCINKSQVMPFETISKLCADFYSGEDIHSAKQLLWELVISVAFPSRKDLRLITRRKNTSSGSKNRADLEDVLKAIQVCDREGVILPKFDAVDLGNIPPVSLEHLDMSVLLSQFSMMQSEMRNIRQAVQSLQDSAPKAGHPARTYAQAAGASPMLRAPVAPVPSSPGPPPVAPVPSSSGPPPVAPVPSSSGPPPVAPVPSSSGPPPVAPAPSSSGPPPVAPAPSSSGPPPVAPVPSSSGPPPVAPAPSSSGPPPVAPAPSSSGPPPVAPVPSSSGPPPVAPAPSSSGPPLVAPVPSSSGPPPHSVASGSEGGQNYISYDIENFIRRKKHQSVALESSFRMIYCLLIFNDPVNLNVIYNSNIDTYLPVAPAIIKIKS